MSQKHPIPPAEDQALLQALLDGRTTHPNELVTYLVGTARGLREEMVRLEVEARNHEAAIRRIEVELAEARGAYTKTLRDAANWIGWSKPKPPEAAKAEPGPTPE